MGRKVEPCEVGTPNKVPNEMGYVFNYRHEWVTIDGVKLCLSCGKKPHEVGYSKKADL